VPAVVFEKGRGPGGRLCTEHAGRWSFDCGAQYFTRRDSLLFGHHVETWLDSGVIRRWDGPIAVLGEAGPGTVRPAAPEVRYVGVGGMSAVARHFAARLDVRYRTRVASCVRSADDWRLRAEDGQDLGVFSGVVVAVPAPEAVTLLAGTAIEAAARDIDMSPCWSVLAGFADPLPVLFDGAFVHGSPLGFVCRCSSKPGDSAAESWTLHATPAWSRAHVHHGEEVVVPALLKAFAEALTLDIQVPAFADGRCWRYASTPTPLGVRCLIDHDRAIVACGDWCVADRVEGAYMSGLAAASAVLAMVEAR